MMTPALRKTPQLLTSYLDPSIASPSSFNNLPLVNSKAQQPSTASLAVSFVSDQDFSLRKTRHIVNAIPPPAAEVA
ncbi:hypothetical protein CKAH01_11966 [Colletotrichum kahawae]|uniref:Uncharacterized protein n=1 Tax=Colletotrichum kahawae TaxID=34407 RepID=A0AAD9YSD2_COLKA|nr:hypothetical protein CKAH01_11966 [Colletotrichum kahawae]